MDLIILTDGVYHLVPVTKAMLADMALFSNVNCFDLLSNAGVSACPINAVSKIKSIPNIIHLTKKGGDGVVREFIELILS